MKKRPEKTAQTKAAPIAAFWAIYKETPISKITVKAVTDGAGLFRSTFYLYSPDVYAILELIEHEILSAWEAMASSLSAHGQQALLIGPITDFYENYGEQLSVLLSPMGDPMFQRKIKDAMRPKMFSLLQVPDDDAEAALIFEFILSAMLGFLTE